MSKALVVIKSMGIGDLSILISSIHAISNRIAKPVTVLAQKNTHAHAILKHDPHIEEVIELDEKEIKSFISIIKKIKPYLLIKGSDYKENQIIGAKEVKKYGGKILRTKILSNFSSSIIIDEILNTTF